MASPYDELRSWARHLSEEVSDGEARVAVERAMSRVDGRRRRVTTPRIARRLTPVLAATMVLGVSNVALAAVANPSVPGDPLYGIDRAYERIGAVLWSGQYETERLDEAVEMLDRGQPSVALDLVEESLRDIAAGDDAEQARRMIAEISAEGGVSADQVADLVDIARQVSADL